MDHIDGLIGLSTYDILSSKYNQNVYFVYSIVV